MLDFLINISIMLKLKAMAFFYTIISAFKESGMIKKIHFLCYRTPAPEGEVVGGPGGGMGMQKTLLKDRYKDLELKYTFMEKNKYQKYRSCMSSQTFSGIYFAIKKTKDEHDAIYVCHDAPTAYGLALLNKKYILIFHHQGPRVEEKKNFEGSVSWGDKKIIQHCEKFAFKKAFYVCFPSKGAENNYFNSKYRSVNKEDIKIGPVLYNTICCYDNPEKLEGITKNDNEVLFLSTGTLTVAKGSDRVPKFFETLLPKTSKNLHWILVGSGILKEQIIKEAEELEKKYKNFKFTYIPWLAKYSNVQYLQDICDVYIMLHRISVFDLAILELMRKGKPIILSNIGGNKEFNKDNNIIFFSDSYEETVNDFLNLDIHNLGNLNKKVYEEYFSNEKFIENTTKVIDEFISCSESAEKL